MISPTGKAIRDFDPFGSGRYGAPRGKRVHRGVDFICEPGQEIVCPIGGLSGVVSVVREAKPYADTPYSGLLLKTETIVIKMFYFKPKMSLIGDFIAQGDVIGTAQDIAGRYHGMTSHIHLEIVGFDPGVLLNLP